MKALKWINTAAFAAMVAVNALAELVPIGGMTTGQISAMYPNLFTPAPITFAVWGLIYFLMLLYVVYQHGVLDGEEESTQVREKIGPWFAVSCGLNILWIILWHSLMFALSVMTIVLLLIVLIVITKRLRGADNSLKMKVTTQAGFSLYYGWIIAATIANISVFLTYTGWDGWGISQQVWTMLVLLTGAVIAGAVVIVGKDRIAGAAVMWAYVGIFIRHVSLAQGEPVYPFIIAAVIVCEMLILGTMLYPAVMRQCSEQTASGKHRKAERKQEETDI